MPCGHHKTTTVTADLRTSGLTATAISEDATNGQRFLDHVTDTLVPVLRPGDTVILDNLQAHKVAGVREAIAAAGAPVVYLPPYSPEFRRPSPPSHPRRVATPSRLLRTSTNATFQLDRATLWLQLRVSSIHGTSLD